MSPALQKLRKGLDQAKARSKQSTDAAAGHGSVGFDVIEMLFAAIVTQDAEIRKLKAGRVVADADPGASRPASAESPPVEANADAYVGHTEANVNSPVYNVKSFKPPHA